MDFNTEFKGELIEKLKNKGLTDNSIKMYIRNLEKLNDDLPLKNFNFLKDLDKIASKLVNYKDNTKRGYYISICSALSTDKETKQKKKLYEQYFNKMIEMNKELKQKEGENLKTDTQNKNWVDWSDVLKIFDELKEKVSKFSNSKEINEHNYNVLLSYLILALYVFNPPRRNQDYQQMYLIKTDEPSLSTDRNYLDFDKKEFIFNVYKTSKKEGQQRIPIDSNLMEIINLYLKFHPIIKGKKIFSKTPIPLLVHFDGSKLNKVNSITRILNKIFNKSVGSSMLRHSFLSDKYKDVVKEQKSDAKAMGHSVSQQKDYVKID